MKDFSNGTVPQPEPSSLHANGSSARPDLGHALVGDRFAGKVVLLASEQPGENYSLALRFARRGTDVAIVYRADLCDETAVARQTAHIQTAVEATGQRCLLLPADATMAQSPTVLIQHIVAVLGRLNFFVSRPTFAQPESETGALLPHSQLIKAAMQAILKY
jgi:NAD(P)-dependent dehydrogenase (short-subunit alcohol dehydrogenase family)